MSKRIRITKVPRHMDRYNRGRWASYVIPYPGSPLQVPLGRHHSQAEAVRQSCEWLGYGAIARTLDGARQRSRPLAHYAMDADGNVTRWEPRTKTWEGDYA